MNTGSLQIFGFSAIASLAVLLAVLFGLGWSALLTVLILVVIELTFSFDNAIVNAKVLERLSPAWQTAFLTIGIILAIFVVRLVLPVVIVQLSAGLSFGEVISLALDHPDKYAHFLVEAHPLISSFGGSFLLALALDFFINGKHKMHWARFEGHLKKAANFWMPSVIAVLVVSLVALFDANEARQVLAAGWLGGVLFLALKLITSLLEKRERGTKHLAGWAGLGLFIYLQVLDASFSLDGVIGAFAITNKVLLIAAGLGIGALWVRSLTIFMVRRGTLNEYIFLEHGAYYTILVLAASLFAGLFIEIPGFVTGLVGVAIIATAVFGSLEHKKLK